MGVGHQKAAAADAGGHIRLGRAVDGHALADDVVVSDLDAGLFALEGIVLGRVGNDGMRVDAVARADVRMAVDDGVGADDAAGTDAHPFLDDGVGTDLDVVGERGTTRDDGGGVASAVGHRNARRSLLGGSCQPPTATRGGSAAQRESRSGRVRILAAALVGCQPTSRERVSRSTGPSLEPTWRRP